MSSFFESLVSGLSAFWTMLRTTDWPDRLSRLQWPALSVELLQSLALGIALAACAGLRAWLPLLALGASIRFQVLPAGDAFAFLGTNTALTVFAIATLVELIGDKIPAVDHALDLLATLLKPAAGMVLAASVLWTVDDPIVALALGLMVGAPTAFGPHLAKATVRGVVSPLTAGLAAPVLSVLEDVIAFGLVALAILFPLVVVAGCVLFGRVTGRLLRRRSKAEPPKDRATPPGGALLPEARA